VTGPNTLAARAAWRAPALLAAVAIAARIGAIAVHRHLSLDDGAYGVSIADMRHGLAPYRDVFSSQGPLHYPLLYAGDLLGLRAQNAPRVVPVLSGVVTPITTWAIARRLGSTRGVALVSGLLVATTGSLLWVTGPVSADGPAIALAMLAVWAALRCRDAPGIGRAVLTGALFGAALAVKPLVFPAVVPVVWWLGHRRRPGPVAVAAVAAIAVWFVSALPWGLGRVWDQSVAFHLDKRAEGTPVSRFGKLASTLAGRDLVLLVAVALGLVALLALRSRVPRRAESVVVLVWLTVLVLVLVLQKLLLVNHMAVLAPVLALVFALHPPPLRWLAISLVVLVPVQAYQLSDIVWPEPYRGMQADVVRQLRALPPGALAASDIPGLVWQAGRVTPRRLNDNSNARISTGRETTALVLSGAGNAYTCAMVIWSFRWGENLPGLRNGLARLGYTSHVYARNHELWRKSSCNLRQ
jgi:Dolichyl-phosphate-mannose-protein mannosyltransferase